MISLFRNFVISQIRTSHVEKTRPENSSAQSAGKASKRKSASQSHKHSKAKKIRTEHGNNEAPSHNHRPRKKRREKFPSERPKPGSDSPKSSDSVSGTSGSNQGQTCSSGYNSDNGGDHSDRGPSGYHSSNGSRPGSSSRSSSMSASDSNPDVVFDATSGERPKEKYVRFEAVSKAKKARWSLSKEQTSYFEKQFCEFVQDSTSEEGIISRSPVPENVKAFNATKVDNCMGDIFKSTNRPLDLQVDESLCKAQQRLLNTMGPLGKVWTIVDNIRSGKSGSTVVDTHKMLHLIEQSITLLGQSNVSFNFHRRLAILS